MPEIVSPLELSQEALESPPGEEEVDIGAVRDLVLRAHPDIVPELVGGGTIAEVLASVEPAREAFARLTESIRASAPEPVTVPAGGGSALPVDPALLPPAEKIRRGLQATPARSGQEG